MGEAEDLRALSPRTGVLEEQGVLETQTLGGVAGPCDLWDQRERGGWASARASGRTFHFGLSWPPGL